MAPPNPTLYSSLLYRTPPSTAVTITSKHFFSAWSGNERMQNVARAIFCTRNPKYAALNKKSTNKCLRLVVKPLRFAMSTLDLSKTVPTDVTVFLANLHVLMEDVSEDDVLPPELNELNGILFPTAKSFPNFAGSPPQIPGGTPPSDEELDAAPLLDTPAKKRKARESDEDDSDDEFAMPILKAPAKPAVKKQKASDGSVIKKASTSAKPLTINIDDDDDDDENEFAAADSGDDAKPSKRPSHKSSSDPIASRVIQAMPAVQQHFIDLAKSKGENFKVIQMPAGKNDKNSYIITIVLKQGNKKYQPKSNLGPGGVNDTSTIPRLDYEEHYNLPIGEAIKAPWTCIVCLLLRTDCHSHGIGVECVTCVQKKIGHLCDHGFNGTRLQHLVSNFKELTELMKPNAGPLDLPFLRKLANRAITTAALAKEDREEFADQLRKFLAAVQRQNTLLGSEGFESLFPDDLQDEIRDNFNTLIDEFNESLEEEDGDGDLGDEPDKPIPEAGPKAKLAAGEDTILVPHAKPTAKLSGNGEVEG